MKTPPAATPLYYLGLMSGTSLDGIDVALISIEPSSPPWLVATHAEPMPDVLHSALLALCHAEQTRFAKLAFAEDAFCRLQAQAVKALLNKQGLSPRDICAIGSHGQTVEHAPGGHHDGPAYTLQLDNPSLLAELTGCTVVADFRRRDLAAGGQAAPLAPAFHQALFGRHTHEQLILNLGGFANVTWLPRDPHQPVMGFDTGPANVLLDAWFAEHQTGRFDQSGAWAASGKTDHALLSRLLAEPFFHQPPPRSTGRELFHLTWLKQQLTGKEAPVDVQATLAELTAISVARGIEQLLPERPSVTLITCGGGAHNNYLMTRLAHHLPNATLTSPSAYGWPEDWIEAGAFAWLAHQRLHLQPGNLPSVTGARGYRVLGGIYAP
ncbi:anhydro-N-acetylmuramic acid kinase [Vreelandella populi]|uniref:Anhydro-N-acetylmuramic acid kinase n=1 Tax=Vreelandella populi TaxID=2498858 RepID=A0A3S0WMC5_9GAMM|nr:anhydro-N-acetylmuramic acid kinase [Halomonas populi]RUR41155.1 anhydro-N-acetylmuramic acid kinase [Halomonas populi]RUR44440.1 anhydro-N-acetylmuramic acid kinase [Halomonas populi]